MSAKLTETTNEHMKIDKENIPDCICIVQNIDGKHWILVCVCNIKTLHGDYIDVNKDDWLDKVENESYSNTFDKYPLPCFLILDSMGGKGTINPDTERLIQALRHWLTNQSDLNKKRHKLDEINMPYFIVECMQQLNSYDGGFDVFRNIVGMMFDKITFHIDI